MDTRLKWAFQKINKPDTESDHSLYLDVAPFIAVASAAGESDEALIELVNQRLFSGTMSAELKALLAMGLAKENHRNLNSLKQNKVRHVLMVSALCVEFIMQEQ